MREMGIEDKVEMATKFRSLVSPDEFEDVNDNIHHEGGHTNSTGQ